VNRTNAILGAGFLAFGLYLVVSGVLLPAGIGRLPGAGFFPIVIGIATVVLALLLLASAFRGAVSPSFELINGKTIAAVVGLTFAYLLLWGSGLFALRTAVFLALLLRTLGERWKTSMTVSAVLTAAVTLAFQLGLRVSLE
jgi:putative tricarboxylic transport membrane protein